MDNRPELFAELQESFDLLDEAETFFKNSKREAWQKLSQCHEAGISIDALAEVAGVSRQRIHQIIREVRPFAP